MTLREELSVEQDERLSKIKSWLSKNESNPLYPYWFVGEVGIGDEKYDGGFSFCRDCILALLPNMDLGEDYDGGFLCESDGCEHCEKCGKLLQYTLTDYGVDGELNHFVESPPSKDELLNGDTCYELGRIAYGISTKQQAVKFMKLFKGMRLDLG